MADWKGDRQLIPSQIMWTVVECGFILLYDIRATKGPVLTERRMRRDARGCLKGTLSERRLNLDSLRKK